MYCQRAYPQLLGYGPDSIAADGCYLASFAALETWADHSVDPVALNDLFKAHGQFVGGELIASDSALAAVYPGQWQVEVRHCEGFACPQAWLDNSDPDVYVIVEMSGGSLGSGTHFSPIYSWKDWTIADAWTGTVRPISVWGASPQQLIQKVVRYTYVGPQRHGAPPAPAPTPAPAPSATYVGVVGPRGARVRAFPGQDQIVILQPPPGDPSIVDAGTTLSFDGWCHHVSHGAADPVPHDQWSGAPDDRWYRTQGKGHWLASADVNYLAAADPPANLRVSDPSPAPAPMPPPVPTPQPDVPTTSYVEPAAEWRGGLIPNPQNYDAERREPLDAAQKADPNALNTGPAYNLAVGGWVILHHTDGPWRAAEAEFENPALEKSVHYLVRQDGTLAQYVDEKDASYGCGVFEVNRKAINVEVESLAGDTYTAAQLQTLIKLLAGISHRRGIPLVRGNVAGGLHGVLGHSEVPYATQCPGRLLDLLPDVLVEAQTVINAPGPVPAPRPNPVPIPAPRPVHPTPGPEPAIVATEHWLVALLNAIVRLFVSRR